MSNWFSKATNVFKGPGDETPRPFEMECECGVRHAGLRKRSPQRIVCRDCGTSLFVLPRDVYPPPKMAAASSAAAAAPAPGSAAAAEEEPPPTKGPRSESQESDARPGLAPVQSVLDDVVVLDDEAERKARKPKKKKELEPPPRPEPPRPPQRLLRPYHFIFAAVGLVLVFTGYFAIRSQNYEHALVTYKEQAELGMAAVSQQKWLDAKPHLEQAADAADILDRHDAEATRIRQYRSETVAMGLLAPASLIEIVAEADRTLPDNVHLWPADFHSKYYDRWLILELPARRLKLDPKRDTLTTYLEWSVPTETGRPVVLATFPALEKFPLTEQPRTVIIGVQLESVTWERESRKDTVGRWIVRFNQETSILWTDLDAYEAAGMTFSDDYRPSRSTEAALQRQRESLGLETPAPPAGDPDAPATPASPADAPAPEQTT